MPQGTVPLPAATARTRRENRGRKGSSRQLASVTLPGTPAALRRAPVFDVDGKRHEPHGKANATPLKALASKTGALDKTTIH
ncbi:MAG: hypothetical protein PHW69_02810 [Elusimicrobiaceae bacterium]|nr:hypothetical protein [Elusimicrobiaceae bacterium]